MHYRNMNIGDYDAMMALWQRNDGLSLRDADSRESIERYLRRNPGLSFVAERENRVLGTIMGGHDGRRGYIQHLAVSDETRGSGVGSRLVELCLQALKNAGIAKTHVHVLAGNRAGRNFWRGRQWFERDEIVMYSFINGDNPDV